MRKYRSGCESSLSYSATHPLFRRKISIFILLLVLNAGVLLMPSVLLAQDIEFSYSYINVTRNNGGGTAQQGDTIEVHALVKINSGKTASNFFYTDTIRTGTEYVPNSMRIITNEGINFRGPFTDTDNDDVAVYDPSPTPRIRVNIGTGTSAKKALISKFTTTGSSGGGGTVKGGDIPKHYGNTLLIVAYKLVVTANDGDTIHLSGNYYYRMSSSDKNFHFDYPGIKVIANQGLCVNFSSATFTAESSFGSGVLQNRAQSAIVPGYTKINIGASAPGDNYYSIANNTSADGTTDDSGPYKPTTNNHRVFGGFWDIVGDHTGASDSSLGNAAVAAGTNGGYMLVVNAAFTTGEVYRDTIKNVCPNTYYEFSAWIRNLCGVCGIDTNSNATYKPGVLPNLTYAINDIDYYTTGNIEYDKKWAKRGFIYKTGPTDTSFVITIKNNAAGGGGNDWALDDIKLATCYPNLIMNPNDTATACVNIPITISDTVKSYFNNYGNYQWERSVDGVVWTAIGTGGSKTPVLENGLYVYHVDYVLNPSVGDSGTYFRLKVATTPFNISNINCSVDKSQKVFLKVYNAGCGVLESGLLNFSGSISNNRSNLYWAVENGDNIKGFDIEKSTDGVHYSRVGNVGYDEVSYNGGYSFTDPDNTSNVNYYRLKLLNHNNTTAYSKTIMLYTRNSLFKVSAINPFSNNLKINIFLTEKGIVQLNLSDMYGKILAKKTVELNNGNSQVTFDNINTLPSGMYILNAVHNGVRVQNKLIKNN